MHGLTAGRHTCKATIINCMPKRILAVLFFCVLVGFGFSFWLGPYWRETPSLPSPSSGTLSAASVELIAEAEDMVSITPVDFFSGELKRLKGHLDFVSAVCFKIKTAAHVKCEPEVEVWCDGERVDIAKYGCDTDSHSDEVSFTLRRIVNTKSDKVQYQATFGGIKSFDRILDKPTPRQHLNVAFGPLSMEQEIKLKPGSSIVVWAMGGGHGVDLSKPDEVEKKIKQLPWVMIVRLTAEYSR